MDSNLKPLGRLALVAAVSVLGSIMTTRNAAAREQPEPVSERWNAYLVLEVKADNLMARLFSSVGELGASATEECLDTEYASFVNMAKCAAEKGDPVAVQCMDTRSLEKKLLARLDEQRQGDPTIPHVAIHADCVGSRDTYEFDRVPLEQVAKAVGAKQLPNVGVIMRNERVLDDHFHNWTLRPCQLESRGQRNTECNSAMQKITVKAGVGPYLTKAQRNDRLRARATVAEASRAESVRQSKPITGAFGMTFGIKTALSWKPAEANALGSLPGGPPLVGGILRGWVVYVPPEKPEVFESLENVRYFALLKRGLIPVHVAAIGKPGGDCVDFKHVVDDALAAKYGRGSGASLFTDGKNEIRTVCYRGRFAISFIDIDGYASHNRDLQVESDAAAQRTTAAAKESL